MKVLFIGGTGNISSAVSRWALKQGMDLYLLNRGKRGSGIPGAKTMVGNIHKPQDLMDLLKDHRWDCVVNWIAFGPAEIVRDIELFTGKTRHYIFISSASVYQKPPCHPIITESTPLANPFWDYAQNKIACEDRLNQYYRETGFPMTIVRPSLTYDTVIPLAIGGWNDYTIIDRMQKGGKVVVPGDGTSLWTVTHADDFARGFVELIGHPQAIGHAFHITSDELLTWDQIYQATAAAAGTEANIVHIPSDFIVKVEPVFLGTLLGDKSHSVIFDNTKIKRLVPNFHATIPYSVGIKRTMEWFQADPIRMALREETNATLDRILNQYEKAF